MTKKKLWYIAAVLCLTVCLCLSACGGKTTDPNGTEGDLTPETTAPQVEVTADYTIDVLTEGGQPMEGIGVYVYKDAALTDLVWFANTDADGHISFTATGAENGYAVLDKVPDGFQAETSYALTGTATVINLTAEMKAESDLEGVILAQGDVMYDMTVTTVDGRTLTLSELLKEKKAVVLNFWYLECAPCRAEFPYLQAAYEQYSDKLEVLALNPVNLDDASIAAFQQEYGLTFPMAQCDPIWAQVMQLSAYPTTVVIDRYGVISLVHTGAITESGVFESVFEYFVSDDKKDEESEPTEGETLPGETEPGTTEPGVTEPGATEPGTTEPGTTEPGATEPGATEPGATEPGATEPGATEPGATEPAATEPVVEENYVMTVGTKDNPDMFSGQTSRTVKVPAGEKYYCEIYKVSKLFLTISDPDVYVIYNGNTYKSNGSSVNVTLISEDVSVGVKLIIGNDTDKLKEYTMRFSIPKGTISNPYELMLGKFALSIPAGNDQGVTFRYTCTQDGVIMARCLSATKGVKYDLSLYNLNTYAMRNLQSDATSNADGQQIVTIKVSKGDVLQFAAGALPDDSHYYPAVDLKLEVNYYVEEPVEEPTEAATEPAATEPVATEPVATEPAATEPAATEPVATEPVATEPVATEPPATEPVATEPPATEPAATEPPATEPPATEPPATEPPATEPPATEPVKKPEAADPDVEKIVYAVTVTDASRKAVKDVVVYLVDGDETVKLTTDKNGVAAAYMVPGNYTAAIQLPAGYTARKTEFKLTEKIPCISLKLDEVEEAPRKSIELINLGTAYYVEKGTSELSLAYSSVAEIQNYFVFEPDQSGLYQVTTTSADAKLTYWATTVFPYNATTDDMRNTNTVELNVKEAVSGLGYIIGITGADQCQLVITRVGDAVLGESDLPYNHDWQENFQEPPTEVFTMEEDGSKLTYVNLEKTAKAVYNKADGYYHLNSKNGPILYVNLGNDARYIRLYDMLGFNGNGGGAQNLCRYFYLEDGTFDRKEIYTAWMRQYIEMRDETYDVYPLDDALIYMIQNGGEHMGWWDEESYVYQFDDIDLKDGNGWMFAVCYVDD